MADSYTKIRPTIHKQLVEHWLPELNHIKVSRQGMKKLLIFICILPVVVILAMVFGNVVLGDNDFSALEGGLLGIFISMTALAFVYLSKLQACDDAISEVSLTVHLGYLEPMLSSVEKLSCYKNFDGMLEHVRAIVNKG